MAKYSNTIEYRLRTTLDTSGIQKLQIELSKIQNKLQTTMMNPMTNKQNVAAIKEQITAVRQLQAALNSSHNAKLGMLDLSKLNAQLRSGVVNVEQLNAAFRTAGASGTAMASQIVNRLFKMDNGLKSISSTTDKIINTIGNTVRWGLIASAFSQVMNAMHSAVDYTKELDKSLTNIMMVSGETRDTMNEYARTANAVAERLGGTTVQMTEATKVFIQQGKSLQESMKLGEYAVHLANVSEQESSVASDEITAYMNAFNINIEDMGNAISKWAAVANNAAVSVEELSVASQKAASVAATVGVDLDEFAGHIAAIESVTREAPENIGNGLKTIYSRIADLNLGETLEDGINLGSFAQALEKVNVQVLDTDGKLRDAGSILEDLMGRWKDLDSTERAAVAKTVAGRFQLARFEALMNRSDIYEKAAQISRAETGEETYDRMQDVYRNSLEGRSKALQASVEEIFLNLFNTNSFNGLIDVAQTLVDTFNNLIEAVGGGSNALTAFGIIFVKIFNQQMARGINNFINNREREQMQRSQAEAIQANSRIVLARSGPIIGQDNPVIMRFQNALAGVGEHAPHMNAEEMKMFIERTEGATDAIVQLTEVQEKENKIIENGTSIANKYNLEIEKTTQSFQKESEVLDKLEKKLADVVSRRAQTSFEDADLSSKKVRGSYSGSARRALNTMKQHIADADENLLNSAPIKNALKEAERELQSYQDFLRNTKKLTPLTASAALEKYVATLDKVRQEAGLAAEACQNQAMAMEQVATEGKVANTIIDQQIRSLNEYQASLKRKEGINNIINLSNSVMTASFALQSLHSIFDIIGNDELTLSEKFEQLTMNIAMVATMGIPAITQFKTSIDGIKTSLIEWATATWAHVAAEEAAANVMATIMAEEGELTSERLEAIAVNSGLSMEEVHAIAVKKEYIAVTEAETVAETQKQVVLRSSIPALIAATAAEKLSGTTYAKTIGKIGLVIAARLGLITVEQKESLVAGELTAAEIAAAGAAGPLLALAGPLIAIAAVFAGVAVAINAISAEQEKHKKFLEEQVEKTNEAASAVKEHKQAYDDLYRTYSKTGEGSEELKDAALELAEALGIQGAEALANTNNFDLLNEKIQKATETQLAYNAALLEQQIAESKISVAGNDFNFDSSSAAGVYGGALMTNALAYQGMSTADYNNTNGLGERVAKYKELMDQATQAQIDAQQALIENKETLYQQNIELSQQLSEQAQQYTLSAEQLEVVEKLTQRNQSRLQSNIAAGVYDNFAYSGLTDEKLYDAIKGSLLADNYINQEYQFILQQEGAEAGQAFIDSMIRQIAAGIDSPELTNAIEKVAESLKSKAKPELNPLDFQVTNTSDILEKAEISESQFASMQKQWAKSTDSLRKAQEDLNTELETGEKNTHKLFDTQKQYDRFLKDTTASALNMYNGLKDLKEISEDAYQNIANLSSEDLASGVFSPEIEKNFEDIRTALGQALDVDSSYISNDFIATHLGDIQAAAEGADGAIDQLATDLQQDIVANIKFNAPEEEIQGCKDIVNEAIAEIEEQLPHLDVGEAFDTNGAIGKMIDLVKQGYMTVEDLNAAFSNVQGVEFDVEEVPHQVPTIQARVTNLVTTGLNAVSEQFGLGSMSLPRIEWGSDGGYSTIYVPQLVPRNSGNKGGGRYTPSYSGSSGSGGSGGSGGNGGGGKAPTKVDATKSAKSEIDIYQKVNAALDKLQHKYNDLDRTKSKAWGTNYRIAVEKENKNLEKQNKVLKERNNISQKYLEALRTGKSDPSIGVDFHGDDSLAAFGLTDSNKDGTVDNYKQRYMYYHNEADRIYKEAEAYRSERNGELSEEEKAHYDELIKKAGEFENKAKTVDSLTKEYEKTWQDIESTTDTINKNLDTIESNIISIYNNAKKAAQELWKMKDSATDTKQAWAEMFNGNSTNTMGFAIERWNNVFESDSSFLSKQAKDFSAKAKKTKNAGKKKWYRTAAKQARQAARNGTSQFDWTQSNMAMLQEQLEQFNKTGKSSIFGKDETALMEAYSEGVSLMEETINKIADNLKNIREEQSKALDIIQETTDEYDKQYELIDNQANHLSKIIELTQGDKAYEEQLSITQAQTTAQEQHLNMLEQEKEIQHQLTESLYDKNKTFAEQSDEYKKSLEQERAIDENILSTREAIAESYAKIRELSNELAIQNWLDNFQGSITTAEGQTIAIPLEYAANQWERIKEHADLYLDDLNRAWEIQKLQNKYQKLLNDAVDPSIQQKITQQMDIQLGLLRNKEKLSKYEVDYANAQLEILQKTIALEEARANKNQMKLRRDNQGNYSYVYTADESDVLEKENDLLEAQMNGYNISVEASRNAQDQYFSKVQQMADQIREVANDTTLSAEQIEAITQEIIQDGYDFLNAMGEQLTIAQRNGIESYIAAARELTDKNGAAVKKLSAELTQGAVDDLSRVTETFKSAVNEWIEGDSGLSKFKNEKDILAEDIRKSLITFTQNINNTAKNIKTPISDITTGFTQMSNAIDDVRTSFEKVVAFLEEKSGAVKAGNEIIEDLQTKLTDTNNRMNTYYESWQAALKKIEDYEKRETAWTTSNNGSNNKGKDKNGTNNANGSNNNGKGVQPPSLEKDSWVYLKEGAVYYKSPDKTGGQKAPYWGTGKDSQYQIAQVQSDKYEARYLLLHNGSWNDAGGWTEKNQIIGYKTGGYTGAWGTDGKLSVLHEKELVLNKDDTKNMLAAVAILRNMIAEIKLSNFNPSFGVRGASANNIANNVEQRVAITAEFPNVQSATEIEAALLSISDNAYQYAFKQNDNRL